MSVNTMNTLDSTGDTRIEWDPTVKVEVDMARKAFNAVKKKQYLIYKLDADGSQGELMREFDPSAERIIAVPQTVGG